MSEQATVRTVEHAEPSALPETGWAWRRTFAFMVTVTMTVLAWRISERITDVATLRLCVRYAFWTILLMCLLYMAGASAEAITKLVGAIRTTRKETITTAPPPARISTPEATIETPQDEGPAAAPLVAQGPPGVAADRAPWDRAP